MRARRAMFFPEISTRMIDNSTTRPLEPITVQRHCITLGTTLHCLDRFLGNICKREIKEKQSRCDYYYYCCCWHFPRAQEHELILDLHESSFAPRAKPALSFPPTCTATPWTGQWNNPAQ